MCVNVCEKFYFNGIWRRTGKPDLYVFTDELTKGTFTVAQGQGFVEAFRSHREKFRLSFPENEELIFNG